MVRTRQSRVPWLWTWLMTLPIIAVVHTEAISHTALTFTMKKFISDPALITFLGSMNILFEFLISPYTSWQSDRIWTRYGRRRPFVMVGFSVMFITLLLTPYCSNIWSLAVVVILLHASMDFGYTGPWTPLYYEVIPTPQRGRAVIIKRAMNLLMKLFFSWFLIGQYDNVYRLNVSASGITITGEHVIYFVGAAIVAVALLFLIFGLREERPDMSTVPVERFSPIRYLRELFGERQYRLIFLLLFCGTAMTAGLGQMTPLLVTEQFGFTKAQLGSVGGVAILVDMAIILPIAALLADRIDRFLVFRIGLVLSTLHPLAFWTYINYFRTPTPLEYLAFVTTNSIIDGVSLLALEPLIWDYVPRSRMGLVNSGFLFVKAAIAFLVLNGVGLWIGFYSSSVMRLEGGTYDYSSGLLYMFLIGVAGIAVSIYFERQRRAGRLIPYGQRDTEPGTAEKAG